MERKDEFSDEYKGENNSGNEMKEKHGEGAKEQNISEAKEEKHVVEVTMRQNLKMKKDMNINLLKEPKRILVHI